MSDELNQNENTENVDGIVEEENFQATPEEMTSLKGGPASFNRKKVLMVVAIFFVAIIILGTMFSTGSKSKKSKPTTQDNAWAANPPRDFLQRELQRSLLTSQIPDEEPEEETESVSDEYGLPQVTAIPERQAPPPPVYQYPAPPQQPPERVPQPQFSSLVPAVAGKLFASSQPPAQPAIQENQYGGIDPQIAALSDFSSLLALTGADSQGDNAAFYSGASGGAVSGFFLQDDILWIGTIIPAVLVTAINTDLPGNVIARVSQNIYDSRTGSKLLIPQGTLLFAQYNSSVSYAQHRVQIVWDTLIRPDGYMVELEGMNGVDKQGMAGLKAIYKENWFEYVKAAGIITLFSVANAKLTEQVAQYQSEEMAAATITANSEFVREIGGNLISRAMNIQPTLTVSSGEKINIMLNKNIHLMPVNNYPVTQKYILKR